MKIELTAEQVQRTLNEELRAARRTAETDADEAEHAGIPRQGFLGMDSFADAKDTICDVRDEVAEGIKWLQFIPFFRGRIASIVAALKTADKLLFEPMCAEAGATATSGAATAREPRRNFNR